LQEEDIGDVLPLGECPSPSGESSIVSKSGTVFKSCKGEFEATSEDLAADELENRSALEEDDGKTGE
jgi:hypothetical protein